LAAPLTLVADMWQARGWDVAIIPTEYAGHATELAQEAATAGHQVVLAAGGDGTLGEVANGLAGSATALGVLPVGTANSFAQELRLPLPGRWGRHKLLQVSDALLHGRIQQMDLGWVQNGEADGRYWMLWAGVGADGYFVKQVEPRPTWSKKLGRLGYVIQGIGLAAKFPKMHAWVEVDGQVYEDDYVLVVVSMCRLYVGGEIMLSPEAKLDDGFFEVWLFRGETLAQAVYFLTLARMQKHLHNPDVKMVYGRNVTIRSQPIMPAHTDGEPAGHTPVHCQIKPAALRLLVPDTASADLFTQPGIPLLFQS